MIDICVNLHNSQFTGDLTTLLARAKTAGVQGILGCATDLTVAEKNIALCNQAQQHASWPQLLTTAGVHPHDADRWVDYDCGRLAALFSNSAVAAVGECGLDFHRNFSAADAQRRAFAAQIDVACQVNKTLFVHDRDSDGEVLKHLQRPSKLPAVVVHCFTGTAKDLARYLEAGFYIGITGWLCDIERGAELRELVKEIPSDRLPIETDAPFLRPQNAPRGVASTAIESRQYRRRNEPALLSYVLAVLAEQRQQSIETLANTCSTNACDLFGFSVSG